MGRGIGGMQRRVLAALETAGAPVAMAELPWRVVNADQAPEDDWERPSASEEASIRRAVRTLAARGMVHAEPARWCRVVCWLPGNQAPATVRRMPGAEVERAALAVLYDELANADDWDRCQWAEHKGFTYFDGLDGLCEYGWFVRRVLERFGIEPLERNSRHEMAITRAVRRLQARGMVRAYWANANGRFAKIGPAQSMCNNVGVGNENGETRGALLGRRTTGA